MEHTPGPWEVHPKLQIWAEHGDHRHHVASAFDYNWRSHSELPQIERVANAEFIVKACNNYKALLEAHEAAVAVDKLDKLMLDMKEWLGVLLEERDALLEACKAWGYSVPECGADFCDIAIENKRDGCQYAHLCGWAYKLEQGFNQAVAKAKGTL